jgi:serine/threonine-protein kinase
MPITAQRLSTPLPGELHVGPARIRSGTTLAARFLLHEVLGEGGSGRVFRATDLAVGEEVALKILLQEPTPRTLARLAREVRVSRRISHPNIVRVFDLLTFAEERLHLLVMQHVPGTPLSRRVAAQGRLSGAELRRLCQSMASALAVAHRSGIVHRDIKPDNVQIREDGQPFLLDFGSAAEEGAAALTAEGFAPGTPEFMSPEQREGKGATPQSDVYALGLCVAFAAGASIQGGHVDVIPRVFGEVLERCLPPDPAVRWRDGAALERALRARIRRKRIAATLAATAALAGAAALTIRGSGEGTPPVVALAPLALEGTGDDPGLARGGSELLRIALSEPGDLRVYEGVGENPTVRISGTVSAGAPALALQLERAGAPAVELREGPAPDLFSAIDRAVAAVRREVGLDSERRASAAALTTAQPEAWRHFALAELELFEHRRTRALAHARAAASIDPAFVRAQLMVMMITWADGYASRSEGREAMALLRKLGPLPSSNRELLSAVDATFSDRGRDGARRFRAYLKAHPGDRFAHWLAVRMMRPPWTAERLELARLWARNLPDDPEPHNQLAYIQMGENGDLVAAERHLRDALRVAPLQPNVYDSLADVLHRQARISDALVVIRRGLELAPESVSALAKAAEYSFLSDEFREAERYADAAQARVDPEMNAFDRVVRVASALRLVRGDVDGAVANLARWMNASSTGGRASIPAQLAAFSLALGGRRAESRQEQERTRDISDRYHADSFPLPERYVEALAHWSDPDRLEAVSVAFARDRSTGRDPSPASADAVVRARAHLLRGNAAAAVETLKTADSPKFARQNSGASFMAQWLLGQALWKLGRLGEAAAAYGEALRRRDAFGVHPESAFFWRDFLDQGMRLAIESGREEDAAVYRLRLARAERPWLTAGHSSRP